MTIKSNINNVFQGCSVIKPEPGIEIRYCLISDLIKYAFQKKSYDSASSQPSIFFEQNDFIPELLSLEEIEIINGFKVLKKQIEWMAGRFLIKQMVHDLFRQGSVNYVKAGHIHSHDEEVTQSVTVHSQFANCKRLQGAADAVPCERLPKYSVETDIKLWDIIISHHVEGAPFLQKWPFVKISISHSGEYAAGAMCVIRGRELGLDIEKIGKMPDSSFMKIAFTQKEIANMGQGPEDLFKRWTKKEAFLKYIKKGFNESLHKVEILDNRIFHHGEKAKVSIFSTTIGNQYALSMVS